VRNRVLKNGGTGICALGASCARGACLPQAGTSLGLGLGRTCLSAEQIRPTKSKRSRSYLLLKDSIGLFFGTLLGAPAKHHFLQS